MWWKGNLNVSHSVECNNACICPVIPRTWTYDTDEEAIEAWNHRIPTVEAIPKDHIAKAIDKVEEYICDVETDTVKAQGMAQALDIFEKVLGEVEDGKDII